MPIGDLILSLLLAVLAGLTFFFARWVQARAISLWLAGWGFMIVSGSLGVVGESVPWLEPLLYLLSPFLPALLFAGALAHTGSPIPGWLAPATLAVGAVRWLSTQAGFPILAHTVGFAFEPAVTLAGAFVLHRFASASESSLAQRLLAPAFAAVALLDAASIVYGAGEPHLTPLMLVAWALLAPVVLGVQITVALEGQRALRLAQIEKVRSESQELLRAEEERRRMDEHLREVQHLESLGILAGQVAHDFNNLLTVILGNSESACREVPSDSPVLRRLGRIQTAGQQARGLVEQMLIYAGKAALEPKPVQLSHLVEEILELLELSTWKKARLETDLDPRLPPVEGDQTQLRQVVLNLITNASEALAGSSGLIRVRTGVASVTLQDLVDAYSRADLPEGEYVTLEVADTGPGIDESTRARIFEPFFTTKASGRGLGLAAVHGIVQAHRGAIQVRSEPGQGTTFRVLFPRAEQGLQPAAPPRERPAPTGHRGRVLVVDDEEAVLELATEFLERTGFQVEAARGGREAVALLKDRPGAFDAVLLDLIMPDCDGEETLGELRRLGCTAPVVVATGYIDDEIVARLGAEHGVAGWVAKPYEAEDLAEQVAAAIER